MNVFFRVLYTTVITLQFCTFYSFGFGKKKPPPLETNPPSTEPIPIQPPPPVLPHPTPIKPPQSDLKNWDELTLNVAQILDQNYSQTPELLKLRQPSSIESDQCSQDISIHDPLFAYPIGYYTHLFFKKQNLKMQSIGSLYGVPKNKITHPLSLTSHPMCIHTPVSLETTLRKTSSAKTLSLVNQFANRYNELYIRKKLGDLESEEKLFNFWNILFGCLAYSESLTTADQNRSYELARLHGPHDYQKPPGIKFYYDANQSNSDSRLNIGLYQFSPKGTGNISPCIEAWNDIYSSCPLSPSSSKEDWIHVLGSPLQNFNAFCGVHKILQTFHVQINTEKTNHTAPQNKITNSETLKNPEDRCVTLHVFSSYAYNHFGPFQNSTGTNLDKLLQCAMDNEKKLNSNSMALTNF